MLFWYIDILVLHTCDVSHMPKWNHSIFINDIRLELFYWSKYFIRVAFIHIDFEVLNQYHLFLNLSSVCAYVFDEMVCMKNYNHQVKNTELRADIVA